VLAMPGQTTPAAVTTGMADAVAHRKQAALPRVRNSSARKGNPPPPPERIMRFRPTRITEKPFAPHRDGAVSQRDSRSPSVETHSYRVH
jgi:hypothetical protein